MSVGSLLRSTYLLYFSRPAADRVLFRAMKGRPIRSIVEIGVDLRGRTERVLEVAAWRTDPRQLRYAGIDLFECRPAGQPELKLKQAHQALRASGVTVRLIPGDVHSALARMANALVGADLVLIGGGHDPESLAGAWRYVPRMVHPHSLVFQQDAGAGNRQGKWRQLPHLEVVRLAAAAGRTLRRAA